MCLLHWLYSQAERLNITVCAAHFEHGLRGEESLRDCRFVEDFCREHGIELAVEPRGREQIRRSTRHEHRGGRARAALRFFAPRGGAFRL